MYMHLVLKYVYEKNKFEAVYFCSYTIIKKINVVFTMNSNYVIIHTNRIV